MSQIPAAPKGALDGIRILDLSSVIMGPMAAQYLGDMGADIIKIEAPEGDLTRAIGPRRHQDMGALFLTINRNKRSMVMDLKHPRAREVLARMVKSADVLMHSIRTKPAVKVGLSYEAMAAHNPRLVYCHVKGFSERGLYAGLPAFDDIIQALSGLATLQTAVAGEPRYIPSSVADKICAVHAAYAITTALFARERTGRGQEVSLHMFETMTAFNLTEHLWGHVFEPPVGPMGYESVRKAVRRPYRTLDGYLAFLPYSDIHWHRFFDVIGKPELKTDPRFDTFRARMENYNDVFGTVEREFRTRTNAEWTELLTPLDIPMSVVNDIEHLIDEPHLRSVDFWQMMEHPTEGMLRMAPNPLGLMGTPPSIRRLAPALGEHTRELLGEFDFSAAEIDKLLAAKVVASAKAT